jgi:hypothetical protein
LVERCDRVRVGGRVTQIGSALRGRIEERTEELGRAGFEVADGRAG